MIFVLRGRLLKWTELKDEQCCHWRQRLWRQSWRQRWRWRHSPGRQGGAGGIVLAAKMALAAKLAAAMALAAEMALAA
eukprot:gene16638-biopygen5504